MHAGGRFLSCRSVCPCIWRSAVLRKGSFADAFQAHRKTLLLRFGCSSRPGFPAGTLQDIGKGARGSVLRRLSLSGRMQGSVRPARRTLRKRLRPRFLVWQAFARYTGGICAARWRAAPALSCGAFAPSHVPAFSCPSCAALQRGRPACAPICAVPAFCTERLRRGHPAAICVRCQLICFSARGAPDPAPRFCFARRIRSAAGARLAPAAFARKPFYPE